MRTDDPQVSRYRFALRSLVVLATILVVAGCGSSSGQGSGKSQNKKPATPVRTFEPSPHTVLVYSEFPGRVRGKQQAKVTGQVTGVLESKNYQEGSIVHKGTVLFKIDPKPYQATVNQRKANLASAKAALKNSTRIWHRTQKLYKANAVSEAERDQSLSNYQSDKASVQQAQANLQSAQIDLDYTSVKAPITGVTSLRDVDIGSLVTANQTQLTTITQLNPVYVRFAIPENDAFARQKAIKEMGKKSTDKATREATIILSQGHKFPHKGQVDFTQSTINPQTGTVTMRAIVKNPDNQLMPGRYVRVRLRVNTLSNAIVVPEKTIFSGQSRSYVYVAKNGKAKKQFVTLGPDVAEGRVISKGLSPSDSVIVSGLGEIKPGARVKVTHKKSSKKDAKQQASRNIEPTQSLNLDVRHRRHRYEIAGALGLTHRYRYETVGALGLTHRVVANRRAG